MDDKELRRYHRPNETCGCDRFDDQRRAWDILHRLQCDVEYLLQEMNSKSVIIPKHLWEMGLKHIHRELDDAIVLLLDDEAPPESA